VGSLVHPEIAPRLGLWSPRSPVEVVPGLEKIVREP
jgi:hypothetical protein